MVEIQTTNNIVFLITPSLKNVTTSSTNEFFLIYKKFDKINQLISIVFQS